MTTLRPYQKDLAKRVVKQLRAGNATLAVLPTGAGKSVTAIEGVWKKLGSPKALVVAHTRILRDQWLSYGVPAFTWQKLIRRKIPKNIRLVIYDEAHHTPAPSLQQLRKKFGPRCLNLGLTATPYRADKESLKSLWDIIESGPQTAWMQSRGYLCKTRVVVGIPPNLAKVGVRLGDYVPKKLSKAMTAYQSTIFGNPVRVWKEYAEGKKTVVFCVTVAHAEATARQFTRAGIKAETLVGKHAELVRQDKLARFRLGDLDVLITVALINEGWDMPECECVHLLRPTKSRVLWRQMIGRGLRPFKGKCLVIDQAACYFQHGLVEGEESYSLVDEVKIAPTPKHDDIIFEIIDKRGRRKIRRVTAKMYEVYASKYNKISATSTLRGRAKRWVYANHNTTSKAWVVRAYVNGEKIGLGRISPYSKALEFAEHNIRRMDAGKPVEKYIKPIDPSSLVFRGSKGCWSVNKSMRMKGPKKHVGSFPSRGKALEWAKRIVTQHEAGEPIEYYKKPLDPNRWVRRSGDHWRVMARLKCDGIYLGQFPTRKEAIEWAEVNIWLWQNGYPLRCWIRRPAWAASF